MRVISQALDENWQLRPNLLNLVQGYGPTRRLVPKITRLFNIMFSEFKFERLQEVICGDRVAVRSRFSGTIRGPPPGMNELPF